MSENESVSELFVKEIVNNLKNHHAAVLVGAGFSRNAIRLDGSEKLMPDWNELAKIFCEKLGLKYTNDKEQCTVNFYYKKNGIEQFYSTPFYCFYLN